MVLCAVLRIVQVLFVKVTMYPASSIRLMDTRVCAMSGVYSTSQRVMFEKLCHWDAYWQVASQMARRVR